MKRKWTHEDNKKLWKICWPIILICILVIWALNYVDKMEASADFTIAVNETMSLYGDQINRFHVDNGSVYVYLDAKRWNNTDSETQQRFIQEVYALVRMDAITSKMIKHGTCLLVFFDTDHNNIGTYELKEKL